MTKLKDAVFGAAVGDALGVPFEFFTRDTFSCTGMTGFGSWQKPAGTFSDDTSMLIAACDSIREQGEIDAADMQKRFRMWQTQSAYTVDGLFDIGNTTATALTEGQGRTSENSNGNGSLMRIAPLAFTGATDEQIEQVSAITHAHPISLHACVNYVHILRDVLAGISLADAVHAAPHQEKPFHRLADIVTAEDFPRDQISSTGYVVHTLEAALWCAKSTDSFEDCVIRAVELGGDTDTTACVAGALAGVMYGIDAIPLEWMDTLRGKEIIERCLF